MIKYKDKIEIKNGFYKGRRGVVIKEDIEITRIGLSFHTSTMYDVKLTDGHIVKELERDELKILRRKR
jgi:hypothetical protein